MVLQLPGTSSFMRGCVVHASSPTARVVVGALVVGALIIRDKQTHTEGARPPARQRHTGQGAPANSRPPGGLGVAPSQLHPTWGELSDGVTDSSPTGLKFFSPDAIGVGWSPTQSGRQAAGAEKFLSRHALGIRKLWEAKEGRDGDATRVPRRSLRSPALRKAHGPYPSQPPSTSHTGGGALATCTSSKTHQPSSRQA